MRKAITALVVGLAALASTVGAPARSTVPTASCAKADLNLVNAGELTIGTDNPAYDPWYGGGSPKGSKWKINDPSTGQGLRVGGRVRRREAARVCAERGHSGSTRRSASPTRPARSRSTSTSTRSRTRRARAKVVTFSELVLRREPGDRRREGDEDRVRPHDRRPQAVQVRRRSSGRRATRTSRTTIKPSQQPSVFDTNDAAVQALKNKQIDGLVVDLPTAFYVTAVQVPNGLILGQFACSAGR